MNIKDVKALTPGSKGIEVQGNIKGVYAVKIRTNPISKHKENCQFAVLQDDDGSIGLNLVNIKIDESYKGKAVVIKNGYLRQYQDKDDKAQLVLDVVAPEAGLMMAQDAVETIHLDAEPKDPMHVTMFKTMGEIVDMMTMPSSVAMLKGVKDAGWTSEDLRAIMVSLFIEHNRGK